MDYLAIPWLDWLLSIVSTLLVLIGFVGMLTQRVVFKQVISMKLMLQGVALALIHAGNMNQDPLLAQSMTISAVIVETVIIAVALAMIVNVYLHYPAGDTDKMNKLKG
ncbi:MAG: NADH-quinone oxidoreductase subunit K [Anaerolineaceae bacterium]|nr:NADH-quinone oxidoreductase subunit K [Anaerolineaceae bacterium]